MLNNPNNIASEFANKVMIYLTFYGITQDPETKNYILKTLDNPNDITSEFKNKITIHDRVYGITQDPETKNYIIYERDHLAL
ncbi:unnamed protein product [Rhizophagus irregularis]|nr:unnamed protein product [Rhizophagus irregularis]